MTTSPATDTTIEQPSSDVPKMRQCLRCSDTFQSQWSGERICSRCKSSSTWRNGTPLGSAPSSSR